MESPISESDFEKLSLGLDYLNLPDEYWFDVAVYLPPSKVVTFCSQHSRFAAICSDPVFWKRRLEKWYPEVNLRGLKGAEYRAWYQTAYAGELAENGRKIFVDARNSDEIAELKIKKREIMSKPPESFAKGQKKAKLQKADGKIKEKLAEANFLRQKLIQQADKIQNEANLVLIKDENRNYYRILLPENIEQEDLEELFPGDLEEVWKELRKQGFVLPVDEPLFGQIFGIYLKNEEPPTYLIYITLKRGNPTAELISSEGQFLHESLPEDLQRYSSKELRKIYNLPFEIVE